MRVLSGEDVVRPQPVGPTRPLPVESLPSRLEMQQITSQSQLPTRCCQKKRKVGWHGTEKPEDTYISRTDILGLLLLWTCAAGEVSWRVRYLYPPVLFQDNIFIYAHCNVISIKLGPERIVSAQKREGGTVDHW